MYKTDYPGTPHTPVELKRINLQTVYSYLYRVKTASKLAVSTETGLSIPTVAANISLLEERGLVAKSGSQKSTGGRRAQMYTCCALARYAIGVELLKESLHIVAIDIYGTILAEDAADIAFSPDDAYFQKFGGFVNRFAHSLPYNPADCLGVAVSIQGIISDDGETVAYGEILHCTGMRLDKLQKFVELPCVMFHDTEASAFAEVWHVTDIRNAVYLALNRNFGGTMIINGFVQKSRELSSGTIEHMCLDPSGPFCYCGRRGCAEAFCSADRLKTLAGCSLPEFFTALHRKEKKARDVWKDYVSSLALVINNVRMVVDCDFIIGGYLAQFMDDSDFEDLRAQVEKTQFPGGKAFMMRQSRWGEKAPEVGAAMVLIDTFLASI